MIDFDLQDDDLVLSTGLGAEIEVTEDEIPIVHRALQTPAGRIAIPEWGREGFIRDAEFGNEIYNELSEPMFNGFIELARQHCQTAADLVSSSVRVEQASVSLNGPNEVQLTLYHNLNPDPLFLDIV